MGRGVGVGTACASGKVGVRVANGTNGAGVMGVAAGAAGELQPAKSRDASRQMVRYFMR